MNEEHDTQIPQKSLCWNCKHGMCILEVHQEHMLTPGTVGPSDDPFGGQDEQQEVIGQVLEHEHVKAVCYWRPESVKEVLPVLIGFIRQCSQFQAKKA